MSAKDLCISQSKHTNTHIANDYKKIIDLYTNIWYSMSRYQ